MGGLSDPEHPIFAPPILDAPRSSMRWLKVLGVLLAISCCGTVTLVAAGVAAVRTILSPTPSILSGGTFMGASPGSGAGGGLAGVPPIVGPPTNPAASSLGGQALGRALGAPISAAMLTMIEQSWGIDAIAENARRLDSISQSLHEYERLHGHPPSALQDLRLLRGDLCDVFGNPIEYRVVGQPPAWQLRSAGFDRRLDPLDPWLPER